MPATNRHRRQSQTVEEENSTTRHHLYTGEAFVSTFGQGICLKISC